MVETAQKLFELLHFRIRYVLNVKRFRIFNTDDSVFFLIVNAKFSVNFEQSQWDQLVCIQITEERLDQGELASLL